MSKKHDLDQIAMERAEKIMLPTLLTAAKEFEKDDSMTEEDKSFYFAKLIEYEFLETVETLKAFEYDNKRAEESNE